MFLLNILCFSIHQIGDSSWPKFQWLWNVHGCPPKTQNMIFRGKDFQLFLTDWKFCQTYHNSMFWNRCFRSFGPIKKVISVKFFIFLFWRPHKRPRTWNVYVVYLPENWLVKQQSLTRKTTLLVFTDVWSTVNFRSRVFGLWKSVIVYIR